MAYVGERPLGRINAAAVCVLTAVVVAGAQFVPIYRYDVGAFGASDVYYSGRVTQEDVELSSGYPGMYVVAGLLVTALLAGAAAFFMRRGVRSLVFGTFTLAISAGVMSPVITVGFITGPDNGYEPRVGTLLLLFAIVAAVVTCTVLIATAHQQVIGADDNVESDDEIEGYDDA